MWCNRPPQLRLLSPYGNVRAPTEVTSRCVEKHMRLAEFILAEIEPILMEWEGLRATCCPGRI